MLISKARKEDEVVEKGKFVLIQPVQTRDTLTKVEAPVKAVYSGPYSGKTSKDFCYTLVYIKKQTDETKLVKAIESFNQTNFGSPAIKISVEPLDVNRGLLIVSGLGEKKSASAYLQKATSDQSLSALFKSSNLRSFIISTENLSIFKKEKNLIQYMEFFNQLK